MCVAHLGQGLHDSREVAQALHGLFSTLVWLLTPQLCCSLKRLNGLPHHKQIQSANTLLSVTVNIASEMHFNALRSPAQPCLTACCI